MPVIITIDQWGYYELWLLPTGWAALFDLRAENLLLVKPFIIV